MFKRSIFISLIGGLLLFTGCENKSSSYEKMIEDGKIAIVNNDYEKAEGLFDLALEKNSNDKEAKSLQEQTQKLIQASKLKDEGHIEEAKRICDEIDGMYSKSDVVKKQVSKLKEELDIITKNDILDKSSEHKKSELKDKHSILADKRYKYIGKLEEIQNEINSFSQNYSNNADMIEGEATALKLWDDELNKIYGEIKENTHPKEMEIIKRKQLEWIEHRDKEAKKESGKNGDGSLSGVVYNSTLARLTKERCYELVNTYMK